MDASEAPVTAATAAVSTAMVLYVQTSDETEDTMDFDTRTDAKWHADVSAQCVGSLLHHLVFSGTAVVHGQGQRAPLLTQYPVPDKLCTTVCNPDLWVWAEPSRYRAPFHAFPLFIWEMLVEMIVMFHFHEYLPAAVRGPANHLDLLLEFMSSSLAQAKITSLVNAGVWRRCMTEVSALMTQHFSANALRGKNKNNQEFLARLLSHIYDRRFHLGSMLMGGLDIYNTRVKLPATGLALPGAVVPWQFGANTKLVWNHGQLLIDFFTTSQQYVWLRCWFHRDRRGFDSRYASVSERVRASTCPFPPASTGACSISSPSKSSANWPRYTRPPTALS